MQPRQESKRGNLFMSAAYIALSLILLTIPTGFEDRMDDRAVRAKGEILSVDNGELHKLGMITKGSQDVVLRILEGPYKGRELKAVNQLQGRLDLDKLFQPGDTALVVLTVENGGVTYVNPQDHYRLGLELWLVVLFGGLLIAFGGLTGLKSLLSFIFACLMLWKVLIPALLLGYNPVLVSLSVVALLTASIIFLVGGLTLKGLVAFLGALLGVLTSCGLAVYFTDEFKVHGAVMPFAETLLYAGFGHLNLVQIYVAAVFLAASGAVMDLAMDVSASLSEVVMNRPDISRLSALSSGIRVGRAVVGTMTTTLLLAYSGGYITLLMAFMAQGIPLANLFNLNYVAAEVLKTMVGSLGLVTVAPFTALVGALLYTRPPRKALAPKSLPTAPQSAQPTPGA